MKRLSGLMALVAFLSFGTMSTLAFANEPAPAEQKDKKDAPAPKLSGDEKKDEKKDKGGQLVFGDDKKDEKKDQGGK
ncbi:MAG: hypothetical protein CAF45_015985 [Nitrospira sp. CG24E]|nr:MAG: hypothetical protein CAF45_015985 [Nitrospira sp. CG24E]